ncbi:hypothetical protein ACF0H5_021921 [Mactra antiquata]
MAISAFRIVIVAIVFTSVLCQPVDDDRKIKIEQTDDTLSSNVKNMYDKVATMISQTLGLTRESRDKREVVEEIPEFEVNSTTSNETSFEFYERQYFINKTREILEQYLGTHRREENARPENAGENLSQNGIVRPTALPHGKEWTTDKSRVDPIIENKLRELNNLTTEQLISVFRNSQHILRTTNTEDQSIASLCCHYG